ncbi:MAG: hypothetical protein EZS28_020549 [Streblomastix strix]|uniref:Uncharacterized protein n=1 Tax=Streblomastix strix TaxID=222440 RepID=A0A5J4VNA0_9EUKA|nr:MAG: hypothetical protein EZS28_020549 [Streblomastix strix]
MVNVRSQIGSACDSGHSGHSGHMDNSHNLSTPLIFFIDPLNSTESSVHPFIFNIIFVISFQFHRAVDEFVMPKERQDIMACPLGMLELKLFINRCTYKKCKVPPMSSVRGALTVTPCQA